MGFFSWETSDTGRSIANNYSNRETFTVHLVTRCGQVFTEKDYEGYGIFGGQDFHELVAKINGKKSRIDGIDLVFGKRAITNGEITKIGDGEDFFNWEHETVYDGKNANTLVEEGWESFTIHQKDRILPKLVESLTDAKPKTKEWVAWFDRLPESEDCEYQGYFYPSEEEEE